MAVGVGAGFDLSRLEQAIKKADDNLKKIEETNKNVVESIGNSWKKIGEQGLDSYLLSLEKQKKVLKDIASIRFDDKAPEALKKYGENASKSIDQLNTLIDSLNKLKKQSVIT
jgi:ABC-type transporter Mla subunit MlaD